LKFQRPIPDRCPAECILLFLSFLLIFLLPSLTIAQVESGTVDTLPLPATADTLLPEDYPLPPTNVRVQDTPNDAGGSIEVRWDKSPDDIPDGKVKQYKILRAESIDGQPGEFVEIGDATAGATMITDGNTKDGIDYFYKVVAINRLMENNEILWEAPTESEPAGPVRSSAQWFDWRRINALVAVIALSFFIIYYIMQARAGKKLFIRKIAGLEAVDEAVGRATEMGKKIFFIPGISDMDNMQTIAGITILGKVAELAAQYETWLEVPVCRSLVMVTAKEIVKEAHSKVGRPDTFHEDQVHYLTDDQFGYAAAIDGMVVREKPATMFYMGEFFAESLILAETGNAAGAIQIAGTAALAQLPFFIAACDYTLIGEELFAASAYLSKEPKLLGSLKGQDIGKGIILVAILVGIILETFGIWNFSRLFTVID
jgi:hypothetical protein